MGPQGKIEVISLELLTFGFAEKCLAIDLVDGITNEGFTE